MPRSCLWLVISVCNISCCSFQIVNNHLCAWGTLLVRCRNNIAEVYFSQTKNLLVKTWLWDPVYFQYIAKWKRSAKFKLAAKLDINCVQKTMYARNKIFWQVVIQKKREELLTKYLLIRPCQLCWERFPAYYSVSSLVVPKMEEEFSGTGAVKNSKWPDKSW